MPGLPILSRRSLITLLFSSSLLMTISIPVFASPPENSNSEDKSAAATGSETEQITRLVEQLSDERIRVREQAKEKLEAIGLPARKILTESLKNANPVLKERFQDTIKAIDYRSIRAHISEFISDPFAENDHLTSTWGAFQKIYGNDDVSRTIFAEMLKSNPILFAFLEVQSEYLSEAYFTRISELIDNQSRGNLKNSLSPGDLATILYLGTQPACIKNHSSLRFIHILFTQNLFLEEIKNEVRGPIFRKLFITWMEQQTNPLILSNVLGIIDYTGNKEGLEFLTKTWQNKLNPPTLRALAGTLLGHYGTREMIPHLEGQLEDLTKVVSIRNNEIQQTVEIRDVALAMIIHLSGQKPQDFGFFSVKSPENLWSFHCLGFFDNDQRSTSLKSWQEWKKSHDITPQEHY